MMRLLMLLAFAVPVLGFHPSEPQTVKPVPVMVQAPARNALPVLLVELRFASCDPGIDIMQPCTWRPRHAGWLCRGPFRHSFCPVLNPGVRQLYRDLGIRRMVCAMHAIDW